MKWTAFIVVSLVAIIIGAVARAYVIAQLWGWFIASAFNLPEIDMSTAFGLSLFASLFTTQQNPYTEGMDTPQVIGAAVGTFIGQLLSYAFVLAIGGLVHNMASQP